MKRRFAPLGLALFPLAFSAHAYTIDLNGVGYVQYADAQSYSMPFAQYGTDGNDHPTPGDRFYIPSGPGRIDNLIVVATGVNTFNSENNDLFDGSLGTPLPGGMDNAFGTPNAQQQINFFRTGGQSTGGTTYPGTDPANAGAVGSFLDYADTWDASLVSLKSYLAGSGGMVFFFNNNNTGGEQSLAVWAQLWITDALGHLVGSYFDAANKRYNPGTGLWEAAPYALVTEGGGGVPLGDVASYTSPGRGAPAGGASANVTDYILSGGELCALSGAGPLNGAMVKCADPVPAGYTQVGPVDHNLGANNAAYAVVAPELNALLESLFNAPNLADYSLHIDLRMGCDPALFGTNPNANICDGGSGDWSKNLNNGYEQLFIGTLAPPVHPNPEPATLALLGLGLLAMAELRRRLPRRLYCPIQRVMPRARR